MGPVSLLAAIPCHKFDLITRIAVRDNIETARLTGDLFDQHDVFALNNIKGGLFNVHNQSIKDSRECSS